MSKRSGGAVRMSEGDLLDLQRRIATRRTGQEMRDSPIKRSKPGQKYGNTKVQEGELTFDSKAEHRRWRELLLLQRAGEIVDLQRQVRYELIPAQVRPRGGKEQPTSYVADFVYRTKAGTLVCEDVKGAATPIYVLKRKLMLFRHGIEVLEVGA